MFEGPFKGTSLRQPKGKEPVAYYMGNWDPLGRCLWLLTMHPIAPLSVHDRRNGATAPATFGGGERRRGAAGHEGGRPDAQALASAVGASCFGAFPWGRGSFEPTKQTEKKTHTEQGNQANKRTLPKGEAQLQRAASSWLSQLEFSLKHPPRTVSERNVQLPGGP